MRQGVKSVLVVADDDMVAAGVTATLVRAGYEVERKRHGPEVAARVSGSEESLPDLLVIGAPGPVDGGVDAVRSLMGTLNGRRRAIVLMAEGDGEQEGALGELGAGAVLSVEAPAEEILDAVREALRQG